MTLSLVLLTASIACVAVWWWQVYGTSIASQKQATADIEGFYQQAGASPTMIVPAVDVHTDFDAYPPPRLDLSTVEPGEVIGILTVPTWEGQKGVYDEALRNRIPVKEGSKAQWLVKRNLDSGAASHYFNTQGPGEVGNFAMSGHRRSRGDNFLHVPDLRAGDYILFESATTWYIYQVKDHEITRPDDVTVLWPNPWAPDDDPVAGATATERAITLTTCTGEDGSAFNNTHRWDVHGVLVGWLERDAGVPPQISTYWDGK